MHFDLTKKITLDEKNSRLYRQLQIVLYLLAIVVAVYFLLKILFPSQYFVFDFNNPNANSNTVTFVSIGDSGKLKNGLVTNGEDLYFTASSPSLFSKAKVQFELDKKSPNAALGKIIVRKSYRAFFYPDGNTLEIEEYLRARSHQSFGDGSLVSYGQSIYVISNNQVMPIDSPETFLALGYGWENVVPIDADQFSAYTKGSLLTLYSAHPDGTVFQTDNDKKYIVKSGKKYPLPTDFNVIAPVNVSEKGSAITADCQLQKDRLTFRKYSCTLPLDQFQNVPGKDYVFKSEFSSSIQLQTINVELKRDMTFPNFNLSISNLIRRSKENYVPQTTQ